MTTNKRHPPPPNPNQFGFIANLVLCHLWILVVHFLHKRHSPIISQYIHQNQEMNFDTTLLSNSQNPFQFSLVIPVPTKKAPFRII